MTTTDPTLLSGTAVAAVAALAQEASILQRVEAEGVLFTDRVLHRVDTDPKLPKPLEFYTLAGLTGYLVAEDHGDTLPLVHVVSPTRVDVVSSLMGPHRHLRRHVAAAVCHTAKLEGFDFGQYVSLETLAIALQTCFESSPELEALRAFCASVRSTASIQLADDGVSQAVEAKAGIAAVTTTGVKNPWMLAPWRTFAEIPQPASAFVLRFKESDGKPLAGLFRTGDARWQVEAVASIAMLLREELGNGWSVLG